MSFKEQDKIALSDEDMGQVIGGFSLNYLIGGSGSGATGVTLEQTVIPGAGLQATTLQGGVRRCPKCGKPLTACRCGVSGSVNTGVVEL